MICLIAGAVAATSWDLRKLNQLGKLLAVGIVLAVAAVQFTNYRAKLYLDQTHNSTGDSTVFLAIRTLTEPGEVIVIHSPDWSSVPAFYAERRVLNIPDAQMFFHPDKVAQSLALLADESVPLVLFVRESRVHPTWLTDRIGDLNLWPLPLFESSTEITAYARADRYQAFKQQLAELQLAGLTIAQNPPLAPAEKRQPITDSPAAGEIAKAGLFPLYAVFPFDLLVSNHTDGPVLSTHAPTELYFAIPADAQSVTFEFGVNPAVLEEVDLTASAFNWNWSTNAAKTSFFTRNGSRPRARNQAEVRRAHCPPIPPAPCFTARPPVPAAMRPTIRRGCATCGSNN